MDITTGRDETIGGNIERLRMASGMTQAETARQLGDFGFKCTQQMLARIESGARPLRLSETPAVCSVFHLTYGELMTQQQRDDTTASGELSQQIKRITESYNGLREAAALYQKAINRGIEFLIARDEHQHLRAYIDLANWVNGDPGRVVREAALQEFVSWDSTFTAGETDTEGNDITGAVRAQLQGVLDPDVFSLVYPDDPDA